MPAPGTHRETRDGFVLVDKPAGWTSHDVVGRMRRIAGTRRVGHAGTLDPMATGVLVLGINRATKLLTYVVGVPKTYAATIRLGQSTVTDDAEGEITRSAGAAGVTDADVRTGVATLTGDIQQVPSAVSAIKVDGQRAYKRVRDGEDVQLAARPVTVSRFDVDDVRTVVLPASAHAPEHDPAHAPADGPAHAPADGPAHAPADGPAATSAPATSPVEQLTVLDVDVVVDCSSGTYVRALARDLGAALGTGGHLTRLRRLAVGPFGIDDAAPLSDLERDLRLVDAGTAASAVLPRRDVDAAAVTELAFGRRLPAGPTAGTVAALAPDGSLAAVLSDDGRSARPVLVLATTGSGPAAGTGTTAAGPPEGREHS